MQFESPNTEDLDALFESVASAQTATTKPPIATVSPIRPSEAGGANVEAFDVFQRIGSITRKLHDALHELGYDKQISNAVNSLPDARTRLDYIARLTGDAADKVLNTVDLLQQDHEQMAIVAERLKSAITSASSTTCSESGLSSEMLVFLDQHAEMGARQRAHLTEIMLAQDFHDLTGQVIRKIVVVAATLEEQLVKLLLDATPPDRRDRVETTWLNGPVVDTKGRSDVVTNQAQVDDLLESLGF